MTTIEDNEQRNQLLLMMVVGIVIGFAVGIVISSLFHKWIVHPLGW